MNQRQRLIEQIRQQSIQKRAQALREAARNQANNVPIAGAVASGGGRRVPSGCLPPGGLMLTLDLSGFLGGTGRFFLAEDGVENGRPAYLTQNFFDEGKEEGPFRVIFRVSWSGTLWELRSFFFEGDNLDFEDFLATSPELYASEWTSKEPGFPPVSSSPGEEFLCAWRYCITKTEEGFIGIQPLIAGWFEIPLTEFPNVFFSLVEGAPIIWSPEEQGWVTGFEEPVLLGGTREALPLGSFDNGFGQTLTISAGVCSIPPSQL
jgi:hypothetical protein